MVPIVIKKIEYIDDQMRLDDYEARVSAFLKETRKWPDTPPCDIESMPLAVRKKWADLIALRARKDRENRGNALLARLFPGRVSPFSDFEFIPNSFSGLLPPTYYSFRTSFKMGWRDSRPVVSFTGAEPDGD